MRWMLASGGATVRRDDEIRQSALPGPPQQRHALDAFRKPLEPGAAPGPLHHSGAMVSRLGRPGAKAMAEGRQRIV